MVKCKIFSFKGKIKGKKCKMFYTWKIGKTFYTFFSPLTLDNFLVSFLPLSCSQFLSPITQVSALSHNPVSHSPIAHHSPSLGSSLLLHLSAFFAHKATTLSSTSPIPPIPHNPSCTNAHPHRRHLPTPTTIIGTTNLHHISSLHKLIFPSLLHHPLGSIDERLQSWVFGGYPDLTSAGLLYFEIRFFVCGVFFFLGFPIWVRGGFFLGLWFGFLVVDGFFFGWFGGWWQFWWLFLNGWCCFGGCVSFWCGVLGCGGLYNCACIWWVWELWKYIHFTVK